MALTFAILNINHVSFPCFSCLQFTQNFTETPWGQMHLCETGGEKMWTKWTDGRAWYYTKLTLPWCILSGEEAEMSRPTVEARSEVSTRERPGVMVRTLCCPQSHRHCSYPDNGHYLHLLRLPDTLTPLTNFCFPFAREGEVWKVVNWSSHIWTLFRVHRQDTHKKIRTWKSI